MSPSRIALVVAIVLCIPPQPSGLELAAAEDAVRPLPDLFDGSPENVAFVVESGNPEAAERLLMKMPDVDLLEAVRDGNTLHVELIALGDPDRLRLNAENMFYQYAAERRDLEMIRTLLRVGVPLPPTDNGLLWASRNGHVDVVRAFTDDKADISVTDRWQQGTALHQALYFEHDELIDLLLDAGADVKAATRRGWTPMHAAARNGRIDHAAKLIAQKADPNAVMNGLSPLDTALAAGQPEFARWLLRNGGQLNAYAAAGVGDLDAVIRLHPDPLAWDEARKICPSPVFCAASCDQLDVVRHFIDAGVDVNADDGEGSSLLIHAARGGANRVLTFLLEKGADLHQEPAFYRQVEYASPMHAAAYGGHHETIKLLTARGMSIDHHSAGGLTPLFAAIDGGQIETISYLDEHGASIEGGTGYNPLCYAINRQRVEACDMLLELGADPNGDLDWISPWGDGDAVALARAVENRHREIFDLLIRYGADVKRERTVVALQRLLPQMDPWMRRRLAERGAVVTPELPPNVLLSDLFETANSDYLRAVLQSDREFELAQDPLLAVKAGHRGDVELMRLLLERGLKLKERGESPSAWKDMHTALEGAAIGNRKDMVRFLIAKGMDSRAIDQQQSLPLIVRAASAGAKLPVLVLIENGDAQPFVRPPDPRMAALDLRVPVERELVDPLFVAGRWAAGAGRLDTLRTLLRHGAAMEPRSARTLLTSAAGNSRMDVMRLLLELRGKQLSGQLSPALTNTGTMARLEVAALLLEHGADPNHTEGDETALHRVTNTGTTNFGDLERRLAYIDLLVRHGAKLDVGTNGRGTPAHSAIGSNQVELARRLAEHGASVDPHLAAALGDVKELRRIHTTNPAVLTKSRQPLGRPLMWAAAGGSAEAIAFLTSLEGIDVNGEKNRSPLFMAIESGHVSAARALLDAGARMDVNTDPRALLNATIKAGNRDALALLLEHGSAQGHVPHAWSLHSAVYRRRVDFVELLIEHGVPLDATSSRGRTALEMAYSQSYQPAERAMVALLLKAGADPKAGRGEALFWEITFGEVPAVHRYLKAGMDPNAPTERGSLPLRSAVARHSVRQPRRNHVKAEALEIIRALLAHGADPELADKAGQTPLQFAEEQEFPEAVALMRAKRTKSP